MKRFKTSLALFLTGIPLVSSKAQALPVDADPTHNMDNLKPVPLRPLNLPGDNQFAAHRSHSSHSSHASHRSSSGGGSTYSTPRSSTVQPLYGTESNQPTNPGRPALVSPSPGQQSTPVLSTAEKRRLQIMRVQIALTTLGLYNDNVDGVLGDKTKQALKQFQTLKGFEPTGLMTTDTLNALGVPAVQ